MYAAQNSWLERLMQKWLLMYTDGENEHMILSTVQFADDARLLPTAVRCDVVTGRPLHSSAQHA